MKNIIYLILISLFFTISCNKSVDNVQSVNIDPILIADGELSGNGFELITPSNIIITDTTSWDLLLNKIDSYNVESDAFSETDIDFSEYTIIAVFDEIKPHNNFDISISDIVESSDNIEITIEKVSGVDGYTVIIQPFYIVKIPKSDKPIVFVEYGG